MRTTRVLGASALVIALTLPLVGCDTSRGANVSTVDETRPRNTEVCNAPSWIREHAPAGLCDSTPIDGD